jgi:hypothetical protein
MPLAGDRMLDDAPLRYANTAMSLTAEQRRALTLLVSLDRGGVAGALMLAHGFRREMLAGLVLAGLATVEMKAGARTVKVERYRITDDGRKALKG